MTLEKVTMNLNCSVTQSVFIPPTILGFNSIPLHSRAVAIMGHCTEMLHPSSDLCNITELENRQASTLCQGVYPMVHARYHLSRM